MHLTALVRIHTFRKQLDSVDKMGSIRVNLGNLLGPHKAPCLGTVQQRTQNTSKNKAHLHLCNPLNSTLLLE